MIYKALNLYLVLLSILFTSCSEGTSDKASSSKTQVTGTYTLNGEILEGEDVIHVSTFGIEKDLVLVDADGIKLLLENGIDYELTGNQYKLGRIFRITPKGKELIGLTNINDLHFNDLKLDDIKNIRGIDFNEKPSNKFLDEFFSINTEKIFIETYDETPIHPKAQFLGYKTISETFNFNNFLEIKSLKYLKLYTDDELEFDCKYLINNKNLIYLTAKKLSNVSELSSLKKLYHINVGESEITDMNIFNELPNLTELYISKTNIEDITSIKQIKNVTSFNMNFSKVKTIPLVHIPHLKKLNIRNTKVSLEDFNKFKELNPQCTISYNMSAQLQEALKEIDYIKVRTGGTCHTNPDEEETIFEIKDKKKIKEFITHLKLQKERRWQCMCCGSPSFEFYNNGKLQETIGFHHGHSIRWHEEPFGDGVLSGDSIDYICKILYDNDIKSFHEERLIDKKMEVIAGVKLEKSAKQLPAGLREKIDKAKRYIDMVPIYISWEKEHKTRAIIMLRYLGAHQGSWKYLNSLDDMTIYVLNNEKSDQYIIRDSDKISIPEIIEVIKENKDDDIVIRGATRWFFNFYDYNTFSSEQIKEVVDLITLNALTHPRLRTRVKAMHILKEINSFWSIHFLRKVLKAEYKIRPLNEEKMEPKWWKSGGTNIMTLDEPCSDFEYAALFLGELKDQPSIPIIQNRLSKETNEVKKKALQKALGIEEDTQ